MRQVFQQGALRMPAIQADAPAVDRDEAEGDGRRIRGDGEIAVGRIAEARIGDDGVGVLAPLLPLVE